ncbi:hypothetical protein Gohar_025291 [Gossypium harknessii]|uniref:Uncharacterized protein n=1 Tax=Gossypium harknessii TaxID=34285 RepID=A0A7J9HIH7_9ROSI|nr:hypothetical protein [Gossypium harknessii]
MALVVGKDMAIRSFARTFADINLDNGNQDSMPIKCNNKDVEEIAHALEQFIEDKTPHLYGEMISMEVEEFDDDFLCSVFDYLASRESNVNAFLAKSTKYRKIWLQKFSQG